MSADRSKPRRDRFSLGEKDSSAAERTSVVDDELLTDFDLEYITGKARSTWQKARLYGTGPPFIRIGRAVRYRRSEFNRWLAAFPSVQITSQSGAGKK